MLIVTFEWSDTYGRKLTLFDISTRGHCSKVKGIKLLVDLMTLHVLTIMGCLQRVGEIQSTMTKITPFWRVEGVDDRGGDGKYNL